MIEGLKIRLSHSEVEHLLLEQSRECELECRRIESRLPELERKARLAKNLASEGEPGHNLDEEAYEEARSDLRHAARKAQSLRFIAAHLPHEDFLIDVTSKAGEQALRLLA